MHAMEIFQRGMRNINQYNENTFPMLYDVVAGTSDATRVFSLDPVKYLLSISHMRAKKR